MFALKGGLIGLGGFLFFAVLATSASCAEIETSQVVHKGGTYRVKFVALLDAPPEHVYKTASDFNNYKQLSPSVIHSEIVEYRQGGQVRVRMLMRACVAMFCKTLNKVSDVTLTPGSLITYTVVPSLSSFAEMSEQLILVYAAERKTRLHYSATVDPDFLVPPIIGPWLAEKFIKRELATSTQRIELKAREIKP